MDFTTTIIVAMFLLYMYYKENDKDKYG